MDIQKAAKKIKETAKGTAEKARKGGVLLEDREREVKFSVTRPDAGQVFLAGEFNGWNTATIPMKKDRSGAWNVKVRLAPGRYEYNFFADGEWIPDASCAETVENPFGTRNCVIRIDA